MLTVDHMYSTHNWKKVLQQVQTLLTQQEKKFSQIFIASLQSIENLAHLELKDEINSWNISEVIELEKCGYFNARKLLF